MSIMPNQDSVGPIERPRWGRVLLTVSLLLFLLVMLPTSPAAARKKGAPGPDNSITDVPGLLVGHRTFPETVTGTTVVLVPRGGVAGASPSGGAPGDRVTEMLTGELQDTLRTPIHGILLNGGSIFGLDAACGLTRFLQEEYGTPNPLVPGAIIYDLARGPDYNPSNANAEPKPNNCDVAYEAAHNATSGPITQGSVGAGTGATSGGVKGGVGTASTYLGKGIYLGAMVVVNSAGQTYSAKDCRLLTLYLEKANEYGSVQPPPEGCSGGGGSTMPRPYDNTTIGVVATNMPLTGSQAERLAIAANDGMARAMHPSRSPFDGDTIFAVSTGRGKPPLARAGFRAARRFQRLLAESADTWARAINHAILSAEGRGIATPYCQEYPGACPDRVPATARTAAGSSEPPAATAAKSTVAKPDPDMSSSGFALFLVIASAAAFLLLARRSPVRLPWLERSLTLPIWLRRRSLIVTSSLMTMVMLAPTAVSPQGGPTTGPSNAITDVPGVLVGQVTFADRATGTTIVQMPEGSLVGSSTAGPATNRVTEILKAEFQDAMRTDVYGILLNGGAAFGLDAACGLIRYLQENNRGIIFGTSVIPIVPGASIDDLGRGGDYQAAQPGTEQKPDNCDVGYRAAQTSSAGPILQGSVGAGTGAVSGGITGGVGTASVNLGGGLVVGALVIVNSFGKPYNVLAGCELFALELETDDEFGPVQAPPQGCQGDQRPPRPRKDHPFGTIGIVATNMPLTAGQVERMAGMVKDGVARAIRPSHTPFDGDTIYALTTGKGTPSQTGTSFADALPFFLMSSAAVDAYTRAIGHAILNADPRGPGQTYCERFAGACADQG